MVNKKNRSKNELSSFGNGNIAAKNFGYTTVSAEAHKKTGKICKFCDHLGCAILKIVSLGKT